MIQLVLMYVAMGALIGVVAGLLGIGGGLVLVPLLVFAFSAQGVPYDSLMHLALGTSMASIVFTSVSSFMGHHRRGAVRWDIVRSIVPGTLIGTFLGSCVASKMPTAFLSVLFVGFLYYVSVRMLVDRKPKPSRQLPGRWGMSGVGTGYWNCLKLRGDWWRRIVRTVHGMVQCAHAPRDRHLGSHRFPHRDRGNRRLHSLRPAHLRPAAILSRVHLPARAGRIGLRECTHRSVGGSVGSPSPGEDAETGVRRGSGHHGNPRAHRFAVGARYGTGGLFFVGRLFPGFGFGFAFGQLVEFSQLIEPLLGKVSFAEIRSRLVHLVAEPSIRGGCIL